MFLKNVSKFFEKVVHFLINTTHIILKSKGFNYLKLFWEEKKEKIPWHKWLFLWFGFLCFWIAFIKILYALFDQRDVNWEEIRDSFLYWFSGLFVFFIIRETPFFREEKRYFTILLLISTFLVIFFWFLFTNRFQNFDINSRPIMI